MVKLVLPCLFYPIPMQAKLNASLEMLQLHISWHALGAQWQPFPFSALVSRAVLALVQKSNNSAFQFSCLCNPLLYQLISAFFFSCAHHFQQHFSYQIYTCKLLLNFHPYLTYSYLISVSDHILGFAVWTGENYKVMSVQRIDYSSSYTLSSESPSLPTPLQ